MSNIYLSGSIPRLFAKTAAPIILVMVVNGMFNLVDAYFLGIFVSAEALSAVTNMFPLFIFIIATATVVSAGFSSVFARLLGAGKHDDANLAFTNAHVLSVLVCAALIGGFLFGGKDVVNLVTGGNENLATMGYIYISIVVLSTPLMFFLSIHTDALRCEGNLKLMTFVSLNSTLLNVVFNYILIVWLEWGVAGSAYGTVLAQVASLLIILVYRVSLRSTFVPRFSGLGGLWKSGLEMLPLGAPMSLNYVGIALISASAIYNIQIWGGENYVATVGAYGIIIRILTFCYFPLIGLSVAFQTIAGNNYGAGQYERVDASLRLAIMCSFLFCLSAQVCFFVFADTIGAVFVEDKLMISETTRILPVMTLMFFFSGPSMIVSGFFQAIGQAGRAAVLSLPKTFVFLLPLIFILPNFFAEPGIWFAGPVADTLMMVVTAIVLMQNYLRNGFRYGVFQSARVSA